MNEKIDLRMAEAIKLARIAFFSYRFDGTILAIDRNAFDFFELEGIYKDPQSLVGKNINALFVYTGPEGRIRDEIRARGRLSNVEYGIRTLKNTEKWGIHNSYIYIDKDTGEEAIQVCFYDITQRKLREEDRIEQSEQRYKNLFEHYPDSIVILDSEYRIIECNKATTELMELKYENIIGRRFDELEILDDSSGARILNALQAIAGEGAIDSIEIEITMKKGCSKWLESSASQILQSEVAGRFQVISRDITDGKLAEMEMKKNMMKFELEHGNLYLSKESGSKLSGEAFGELLMVGHSGTMVSRRAKKNYQRFNKYQFNFFKLSEIEGENHVLPSYDAIRNLLANLPWGEIVHVDCIEYLASRIGPKKTLNVVQYIKDLAFSKNLLVLVSVDPAAMSGVEMRLIEKESRHILPRKSLASITPKLMDALAYINKSNMEGLKPSYTDMERHFGLSKPTSRNRIKRLEVLGAVRETRQGRKKLLEITEKGKNYLAK